MAVQRERRRFAVAEYHQMIEAGILGEDDRVELIEGEIVAMTPIGSQHAACVNRFVQLFGQLGERVIVSPQNPIRLSPSSEPEPDVALLRPRDDFYAAGHPRPEDVLLLVEVAESSAGYDRTVKRDLYARAGVVEFWLVDLDEWEIVICRQPTAAGYADVQVAFGDDLLSPLAFPDVTLAASNVMGK